MENESVDMWVCLKMEGYLKGEHDGTLLHPYGALFSGKPIY